MNRGYLKFFSRRWIHYILLGALIIVQILQIVQGLHMDNFVYQYLSQRTLNMFALFLAPIFCFWNLSAYTLCTDVKWILRADSPFACVALYARFTLLHALLYVFFSNFVLVGYGLIVFQPVKEIGYVLLLLFFQLVFYLNCAWIYYIVMILCKDKSYLGFLAITVYGLWDYAGEMLAAYGKWVNIATSYVVCSPEVLGSVPELFFNFSVLAGTYVCLAVAGAWLTGSRDFLDWGKAHD